MPWWCYKHEQHSIDEVCPECVRERERPIKDAFSAGYFIGLSAYYEDSPEEAISMDEMYRIWMNTRT